MFGFSLDQLKRGFSPGCRIIQTMPALEADPAYLTDRCCLTCGYRGRELQGRRGQERLVCPQCRQDLYARPARTYAEMEGLAEPVAVAEPGADSPMKRRVSLLRLAGEIVGVGLMLVRPATRGGLRARRIMPPRNRDTAGMRV